MPLNPPLRPLTRDEIRVLGTLMEKERTVPDSYPLTLNTLVLGCNQKTSRDPVLDLSDEQVQIAIDALRKLTLVNETSGSRAVRYGQNFRRVLNVNEAQAAVLGLLLLRGPLTSAEIRTYAERWYKFEDSGMVEVMLADLTEWDEEEDQGRNPNHGPALVQQLARLPGTREPRWMHLLGGPLSELAIAPTQGDSTEPSVSSTYRALLSRIEMLEAQVGTLEQRGLRLEKLLKEQLGIDLL